MSNVSLRYNNSTTRFILVCALFIAFYHFTFFVTCLWLALPFLCSFGRWLNKLDELPVNQPTSYDQLKDALDEVFELTPMHRDKALAYVR